MAPKVRREALAINNMTIASDEIMYANKYRALILSIFCVASLNPFYVWGYYQSIYMLLIITLIATKIIAGYRERINISILIHSSLLFAFLVAFFLLMNASILGSLAFALGAWYIYTLSEKELVCGFHVFKVTIAVLLIPGLALWTTHLISGDNTLFQLSRVPDYLNPSLIKAESGQGYIRYPFMIVLDYMLSYPIYRFMGPFDEPGLLGTIAALLLAADRFKIKSASNLIILVSGLISLSLAFYVILTLYFLMHYFRQPRLLLVFCLFAVGLIFVFAQVEFFSNAILERLNFYDGRLSGDNRIDDILVQAFNTWILSNGYNLFFGLDSVVFNGSSSWKQIPVQSGLLGVILLISIIFMFAARFGRQVDYHLFIFLILFSVSIYQRPDVIKPAFLIILAGGLALLRCMRRNTVKSIGDR